MKEKTIEEQAVKIPFELGYTGDIRKDCEIDEMFYGRSFVHVDENGKQTRIDPRKVFINEEE